MTKQCETCGNFYETDEFGNPETRDGFCDYCYADLRLKKLTVRDWLEKEKKPPQAEI